MHKIAIMTSINKSRTHITVKPVNVKNKAWPAKRYKIIPGPGDPHLKAMRMWAGTYTPNIGSAVTVSWHDDGYIYGFLPS